MVPPDLVVEVVSPGDLQRDRDYLAKRMQYQDRGIPEYWIVDPQVQRVLRLSLHAGQYEELGRFTGDTAILSPTLPDLNRMPQQLFQPGASDHAANNSGVH